MLVIRLQRTGRSGHAQFRVVVQDSRRTPTSGNIVASLGHFNPHTKQTNLNKEKASFYLEHGAQPSDRVIRLLKSEGVKLPKWVNLPDKKKAATRNPEKRRSTAPPESKQPKESKPEEATTETVEGVTEKSANEAAAKATPATAAESEAATTPKDPKAEETEENPAEEKATAEESTGSAETTDEAGEETSEADKK